MSAHPTQSNSHEVAFQVFSFQPVLAQNTARAYTTAQSQTGMDRISSAQSTAKTTNVTCPNSLACHSVCLVGFTLITLHRPHGAFQLTVETRRLHSLTRTRTARPLNECNGDVTPTSTASAFGSSIVPRTGSYPESTGLARIMLPCSTDLSSKTFAIDPFGRS
jgi:hypothetical protein